MGLLNSIAIGTVHEEWSWPTLQKSLKLALSQNISKVENYKRCMVALEKYSHAPFTIQRVCELLVAGVGVPYSRASTYLVAMDKLLSVESACNDPVILGSPSNY
jgi:hypothetical protein